MNLGIYLLPQVARSWTPRSSALHSRAKSFSDLHAAPELCSEVSTGVANILRSCTCRLGTNIVYLTARSALFRQQTDLVRSTSASPSTGLRKKPIAPPFQVESLGMGFPVSITTELDY
jgi:hypothetical protein